MRTTQHGFTRTELLITVVILGILAAVVTPKYAVAPTLTPEFSKVAAAKCAPQIIGACP